MTKAKVGPMADETVDLGEEVEVRKKTGAAMIAVRVSTELLERVQEYARGRGVSVSEAIRIGAEQLVAAPPSATYTVTVRSGMEFAPGNVPANQRAGWATPAARVT